MSRPDNPNKPRSSRAPKYKNIIKPIWDAKVGKGVAPVVVLPYDPNALVEMLSLRMASFRAGNNGVRNEIVGICDELLRQNAITTEGYKNFVSQL